jgi:hypothetical protein
MARPANHPSAALAHDILRPRRLLLGTIALVVLALAPTAASAELVTLGATNRTQTTIGPAFAGSEVVWGERSVPHTSHTHFSILAAVPGSHGSTLFSAQPSSSAEEEITPLGLVASATRIAFAYQVEAPECGLMSGACGLPDLPEVLSVAAFDGLLGGPFRPLGGRSLKNGAIGLSGEEVVLAEPMKNGGGGERAYVEDLATGAPARDVGPVGASGLSVAGPYIASSSIELTADPSVTEDLITVMTLAGTPVYHVLVPRPGACMADSNGVGRDLKGEPAADCGYALDADGTLAITTDKPRDLYWASPAHPQLHPIAVTLASPLVAIADDEIVYVTPAGAGGVQLALTDLSGNTRPISFPTAGGAEGISGIVFDGTNVAWTDGCIYAGSVPASVPGAPPAPACEAVTARSARMKVADNGLVRISLSCEYSPCSGTLRLTTPVKKVTGSGTHKKVKSTTVTIGSAEFTSLPVGNRDSVSVTLNASRLRLLERSSHGLNATATATVPAGSTPQTTNATVSLEARSPLRSR